MDDNGIPPRLDELLDRVSWWLVIGAGLLLGVLSCVIGEWLS